MTTELIVVGYSPHARFQPVGLTTSKEALQAVKTDWRAFRNLPDAIRNRRAFAIKAAAANCQVYSILNPELQGDRDVLLAALSDQYYYGRPYSPMDDAPPALCGDLEILCRAVKLRLKDYERASDRLLASPSAVCELIKANAEIFAHVSLKMRATRKVAMTAVRVRGNLLYHASNKLKADRGLVKAALQCSGVSSCPLNHASKSIRNDAEIVKLAIRRFGGQALLAGSTRLLNDPTMLKAALRAGVGTWFAQFPAETRASRKWCLLAIKGSSSAFEGIDDSLKFDTEFCAMAVQENPDCIDYIPNKVRARKSFKDSVEVDLGPSPKEIREAFRTALKAYKSSGALTGRGHIGRVTLSRKTAAALRGVELPRAYISGFGANWHYPEKLVRKAASILGVEVRGLTGISG